MRLSSDRAHASRPRCRNGQDKNTANGLRSGARATAGGMYECVLGVPRGARGVRAPRATRQLPTYQYALVIHPSMSHAPSCPLSSALSRRQACGLLALQQPVRRAHGGGPAPPARAVRLLERRGARPRQLAMRPPPRPRARGWRSALSAAAASWRIASFSSACARASSSRRARLRRAERTAQIRLDQAQGVVVVVGGGGDAVRGRGERRLFCWRDRRLRELRRSAPSRAASASASAARCSAAAAAPASSKLSYRRTYPASAHRRRVRPPPPPPPPPRARAAWWARRCATWGGRKGAGVAGEAPPECDARGESLSGIRSASASCSAASSAPAWARPREWWQVVGRGSAYFRFEAPERIRAEPLHLER